MTGVDASTTASGLGAPVLAPSQSAQDGGAEAGAGRGGAGMRRHRTARGAIINGGFLVALAGLALVQRVIVARLLLPSEFGLWTVALLAVVTVLFLKNAGIGDKFVQQDEPDQELAFQKAFTIDLVLAIGCLGLAIVLLPLLALAYGKSDVIAPGLVLCLAIVGNALQAPLWIHYRRMNFSAQRRLQAIDPLVTFAVTIPLALAGAGVWSLVLGTVAGAWTAGLVAVARSPYAFALRIERGTVKDYFNFSWPVVVASGSGMLIVQIAQVAGTRTGGLGRTGAIGLAYSTSSFTNGVDAVVTQTIYPALCAVRERSELMLEIFVKSNRLALLWGMPFGLGIALFAPDIVHFIVGDKWSFAVDLIRGFAVVAAIDQLGFNWTAVLRALDRTTPLAVLGAVTLATFIAITLPLFIAFGLRGFAVGWVLLGITTVASRTVYLKRLFPAFSMLRHALRASTPALAAIGAVLAIRALSATSLLGADRHWSQAASSLAAYLAAAGLTAIAIERPLLSEMFGYLRRPSR
ncbi:MAG: oligosaccharide flippase family protein [Solirubrobacteraceae bacterium]